MPGSPETPHPPAKMAALASRPSCGDTAIMDMIRELHGTIVLICAEDGPPLATERDANDFLGIDPAIARANHRRVNAAIAAVAARHGTLVDLHAHFLTGDPSWYTEVIEPSLRGVSEVRRCFLRHLMR